MAKVRKRKLPITSSARNNEATSNNPRTTRKIIRRFHVLLKEKTLIQSLEGSSIHSKRLVEIEGEINEMGGLPTYQRMSSIGQGKDRGGGSETVLITWLEKLDIPKSPVQCKGKQRLLEVGALKPDNYISCKSWLDVTCIDLHSNHPSITERDFLTMTDSKDKESWDIISLSLVINFVPEPKDRGRMLHIANDLLRRNGLLYLVLPLPCVMNSRYLTPEHLESLMTYMGFRKLRERWKSTGKMAYWLFVKYKVPHTIDSADKPENRNSFSKKVVLRTGERNNFCILISC